MPQCVVATAGCYDVLHIGHVDLLKRARALGDHLVVLLNGDDSIKRFKGENRPINPLFYRKAVLEELRSVDHVLPFHEDDPCAFLAELRPNIYVKGAEYKGERIPEEKVVRAYGGTVIYLDRTFEVSSTSILAQIGS